MASSSRLNIENHVTQKASWYIHHTLDERLRGFAPKKDDDKVSDHSVRHIFTAHSSMSFTPTMLAEDCPSLRTNNP